VGCNAVPGYPVHLSGSDLNLRTFPERPDDRGVKGLVHVMLRNPDIVLEAFRDGLPYGVNDAHGLVALRDGVHNNPKGYDVVHLVEIDTLARHFLIDAVQMLVTALQFVRKAGFRHFGFYDSLDGVDIRLLLISLFCYMGCNVPVLVWEKIHESDIFEFGLDPVDTQTAGKRRIDVEGFLGYFDLLFLGLKLEGTHVVEPIAQLDEDDANVIGHGQNHFPGVFGLTRLGAPECKSAQFCYALHDLGDPFTKQLEEVFSGCFRILYGVMEQTRRHRDRVQLQLREESGHLQGVRKIGLPGKPHLAFMDAGRINVGPFHKIQVCAGIIGTDAVQDVGDSNHEAIGSAFGFFSRPSQKQLSVGSSCRREYIGRVPPQPPREYSVW
jgi:hypothetical protein